jgi:membrane associated rhomboid family serine protease
MLAPPSLSRAPYYPVTASVALAAIAVTLMWWGGQPVDDLFMNGLVWDKWQLWRALTSTLLHVNFFHLAFNLYWIWTFGTLAERAFGHVRCAAIFLLLAFGSMLAEFVFLSGGVGLSGVGYGLWGLFWILEKHDARFADAVDQRTSQTFIGWFVLCIVLTVTGVMPVANIAHGVGAVMGVLLGFVICGRPVVRLNCMAGLAAILIFVVLGSTVFWPAINLSGTAVEEVERAGLTALEHHEYAHAVKVLETAVQMRHAPARVWYNLGVACQRLHHYDDAVRAFTHAAAMPDATLDMQRIGQDLETLPTLTITNR